MSWLAASRKFDVPDAEQRHQHRQVGLEGRGGAEMLVHRVRAGEQFVEAIGPRASMIGRPIALHSEKRPPTQSQKPNMLAVSMPKRAPPRRWSTRRRSGARPRPRRRARRAASARGVRVGEGLLGGEGLRGDDEQCGARIAAAQHVADLHAVHVGDEVHAQAGCGVVARAPRRPSRAEVRAADADVDHVGDAPAAMAAPRAVAHLRAEARMRARTAMHPRPTSGAVRPRQRVPGGQRSATCSTARAFGGVDAFAAEHRRAAARRAGLVGQPSSRASVSVVEHGSSSSRG
jgi:hypothetical protein